MLIKYIHVGCVILTFILFFIRGLWMIFDSRYQYMKWTRRVPPVIDTILLVSAIFLAMEIKQYPLVHDWLTAKVVALIAYIGLGMTGLTYGKSKTIKVACWLGALGVFAYIVMVALTKNALIIG